MNVLSLFDGMSCGRIALERLGIQVDNYYASEIDKYAIKIAQKNYPDTKQIGDVLDWRSWDIDWSSIDLVSGGFPCQSWSLAGKQLGDKDERGKMFWVMLDIMKKVIENNPNAYYLMENVRMKKEFEEYITYHTEQALPNVNKYLINSALVSAQNRVRYYWTNIPEVEQPEEKGIVLRDILETNASNEYLAGENLQKNYKGGNQLNPNYKSQANTIHDVDGKSGTICAGTHGYANGYVADKPVQVGEAIDINGHDILKRVYSEDGKSPTLNACTGGNREPKVVCGAWRGRYYKDGVRQDHKGSVAGKTKQMLELRKDEKTNTVTTVQKDNVLTKDNVYWRKLTPIECERLQTVPDNYTEGVSNTQRYKMLGNGWTVDVIAHILKNMELPK